VDGTLLLEQHHTKLKITTASLRELRGKKVKKTSKKFKK
jgi:hypothetical protein